MLTTMQEILFRKPTLILISLLKPTEIPKSMTWLTWETKINFSHIIGLIKTMELNEIITTEKRNRIREVILTKKGRIIAQEIKEMFDKLENGTIKAI